MLSCDSQNTGIQKKGHGVFRTIQGPVTVTKMNLFCSSCAVILLVLSQC